MSQTMPRIAPLEPPYAPDIVGQFDRIRPFPERADASAVYKHFRSFPNAAQFQSQPDLPGHICIHQIKLRPIARLAGVVAHGSQFCPGIQLSELFLGQVRSPEPPRAFDNY